MDYRYNAKGAEGAEPLVDSPTRLVWDNADQGSGPLNCFSSDLEETDTPHRQQNAPRTPHRQQNAPRKSLLDTDESDSEEYSFELVNVVNNPVMCMPPPNWTPPPPYPPQPIKRQLPRNTDPSSSSGWKPSKAWCHHPHAPSLPSHPDPVAGPSGCSTPKPEAGRSQILPEETASPSDEKEVVLTPLIDSGPRVRQRTARVSRQLYKPPPMRLRYDTENDDSVGIERNVDERPPPPAQKDIKIKLSDLLKYGPYTRSPYTQQRAHPPTVAPPKTREEDAPHSRSIVSPPPSPPTALFENIATMFTPHTQVVSFAQLIPPPPVPPSSPVSPPSPQPISLQFETTPVSPPQSPQAMSMQFESSPSFSPTQWDLPQPNWFSPWPLAAPTRMPTPMSFGPSPLPQPTQRAPSPLPQPTQRAPSPLPQPTQRAPSPLPQPTQRAPTPLPQAARRPLSTLPLPRLRRPLSTLPVPRPRSPLSTLPVQRPLPPLSQFVPKPRSWCTSRPVRWFPLSPPPPLYGMPLMYVSPGRLVKPPPYQIPPQRPRDDDDWEFGKTIYDLNTFSLRSNIIP